MQSSFRGWRGSISQRSDIFLSGHCRLPNQTYTSRHYYISSVVQANGSFAHAAGEEPDDAHGGGRFRKKPRSLPFIPPRTAAQPNITPNTCPDPKCRRQRRLGGDSGNPFGHVVRHGEYCDGSAPAWEASLILNLLTPGILMEEMTSQCRTLVLASGTLAPIRSLCAELNLFSPEGVSAVASSPPIRIGVPKKEGQEKDRKGRLQMQPRPLEAGHVINLEKQLMAVSIGHFPDGSPLQVTYSNYSKEEFVHKLGDAIASCVESVPSGGVLVFLPSYAFLKKCVNAWNPNAWNTRRRSRNRFSQQDSSNVWDRLEASKGMVIVETTGSQDKFEAARTMYNDSVRLRGGCILLAVYRGKMSEGVSFNDNYARAVICVGVPLPKGFDRSVRAKKMYNDEQRRLCGRTDLLPGDEWYRQQAYRAIAQALGRCIRHAADYGAIILIDSRHCDDGSPNAGGIPRAHKDLPTWMRHHVKNLSGKSRQGMQMFMMEKNDKEICGSWPGLVGEMKRFFRDAKPHAEAVLAAQQSRLKKSQNRTGQQSNPTFEAKRESATNSSQSQSGTSNSGRGEESTITPDVRTNQLYTLAKQNKISPSKRSVVSTSPKEKRERFTNSMSSRKNKTNTLRAMFDRQRATTDSTSSLLVGPSSQQTGEAQTSSLNASVSSPAPLQNENPASETSQRKTFVQTAPLPAPENLTQNEENLCVICEEQKKTVLLLPCRHLCLCRSCSNLPNLMDCPMCRSKIADKMEVFI